MRDTTDDAATAKPDPVVKRGNEIGSEAVDAADALLIPAGVEHWYRNESEEPGAFVCVVPNGDDEIELVE